MEDKKRYDMIEEASAEDGSKCEYLEYEDGEKSSFREERYEDVFDKNHPKTLGFSIAALVVGVISVLASIGGVPGVILGALAIGAAVFARWRLGYFDKFSIAAIIIGIFGIVFGAVGMLFLYGPLGDILFGAK